MRTVATKRKRCSKCKQVRPRSAFARCSAAPDRLQYYCRDCNKLTHRDYNRRKVRKRTAEEDEAFEARRAAERARIAALPKQYAHDPDDCPKHHYDEHLRCDRCGLEHAKLPTLQRRTPRPEPCLRAIDATEPIVCHANAS